MSRTNDAIDPSSASSKGRTTTASLPVDSRMPAATASPASASRTASVTAAPRSASTRAVSTPMPDEAPVTIARIPDRSIPAATSSAVECSPNGVRIGVCVVIRARGRGELDPGRFRRRSPLLVRRSPAPVATIPARARRQRPPVTGPVPPRELFDPSRQQNPRRPSCSIAHSPSTQATPLRSVTIASSGRQSSVSVSPPARIQVAVPRRKVVPSGSIARTTSTSSAASASPSRTT